MTADTTERPESTQTHTNRTETTALQKGPQSEVAAKYEPQDLKQAQWLAQQIASSGLAPSGCRKPQDVLVMIMTGAELGLRCMESLRGIYVINGRPTLKADLLVALVRRSPKCEYFTREEMSHQSCTYRTKRTDQPKAQSYTFTIQDAKRAGLAGEGGKGVWQKYPDRMLRARAASALAREEYPEVILGLYTPEEAASIDDGGEADPVVAEIVDQESPAPEPTPEPDPTATNDDPKRRAMTERIKERLAEAELEGEAAWEALATWACDQYEVDKWEWLEVEQLVDLGQSISKFSADGGPLSPRRLWLDRWLDVPTGTDWKATGYDDSDDWQTVNGRWRSLVAEAADGDDTRRQYHESLKAHHEASSFKDLTTAQIMDDVARLERRDATHPDDGMPPRLDYILAQIDEHIPQSEELFERGDEERPHDRLLELVDEHAPQERYAFMNAVVQETNADKFAEVPDGEIQPWIGSIEAHENPAELIQQVAEEGA